MRTKVVPPLDPVELRRRAEQLVRGRPKEPHAEPSSPESQRLVHELQVHQVELEMQNEELRRARDVAEAAMEKYSRLFDFAPIAYLTLGQDGSIEDANLAAADLLGTLPSGLPGRRLGVFLSATSLPDFNDFLARAFQGLQRESCEATLPRHGHLPVEVRIEGALAGSGRECLAAVTDLTEHNHLLHTRSLLRTLESTGILAAGIAHDFNNLLVAILLNLEMTQALSPPGSEAAQFMQAAADSALAARGLTHQLISLTRNGGPHRKPTDVSSLIRNNVQLALTGSKVRPEYHLAEKLPPVDVDPLQLGQVIRNLTLNACEAMPDGGLLTVAARIRTLTPAHHPALPAGDYLRIDITDRGIGIPGDVLPKIFDPYFSTKQRGAQKGMGLGLTICHSIVLRHGGTLTVDSEVNSGSTFHVDLPATWPPGPAVIEPSVPRRPSATS